MSEERKANLVIAAENQTKGTLQEIKQDAASMAQSVEQSGQKAAKGLGGIGTGGEEAAKKLDGSARSIIGSIQRTTATMEAGEKGTAKYFEALGKQRGVSGDVLEPYLAQLRKAELAQAASVKGMGSMEMSAKATAAAMRGVPAQITDIAVSLQGGQRPLTVLLQQGGQLKDMFGGVGAATKALTTTFVGMLNPVTVLGAGLVALGTAYYQGSSERDAFVRSIVLTGNASGVTAGQLRDYAREIDAVVGTQAQAAAGLAAFASAGIRGGEELKRYTQTAIEWEKATGQAVEKTAEQFASLQKDPLAAVLKLNEGTNFLTTSVYEQIKALEQQGDKTAAAQVAMGALDSAMRERSLAIQDNLGYIERGWRAVAAAAKDGWDAILNVGRQVTIRDEIARVQSEIDKRMTQPLAVDNPAMRASREKAIANFQRELGLLNEKLALEELNAAAKEESNRVAQVGFEFDKKYAAALQGEISLQDKLARARKEAVDAKKSEADIAKVLAYVTEEHNKKIASSVKAYNKELSDQQKLIGELSGLSSTFYKDWGSLNKQYEQGRISLEALEKSQAALLAKQPAMVALAKEEAAALALKVKDYEAEVKAQEKLIEARKKAADQVEDVLRKAQEEEQAHAIAAASGMTLAEAIAHIALARAEDNYQKALSLGTEGEILLALQREIDARRELASVMQQRGVREANEKAAKDAAKEWEKISETIGSTLADYIMGGGKDAATYLKRLFATLVLQPVVKYGVQQGMNAIGLGGSGGGGAGGILGGGMPGGSFTDWSGMGANAGDWLMTQSTNLGLNGMQGLGDAAFSLGNTIKGVDAWLKDIPGMSGGLGSALGYAGALYSLSQGQYGSAAGAAIGTAILPGIGTMIGSTLGGLVDGLFGKSTPHAGAASEYQVGNLIGGNAQTAQNLVNAGDSYLEQMQKPMDSLVLAIGSSFDALAKNYGKTSGYSVGAGFTSDNDDKSAGFFHLITPDGQTLDKWTISRKDQHYKDRGGMYDSDSAKGFDEYLKDVAFASLSGVADIVPAWAADMAKATKDSLADASGADSITAFQNLVTQIAVIEGAFTSLGQVMPMFVGITDDMKSSFLELFGTIDNLTAATSSFYGLLYSEQERMTTAGNQINDTLKELNIFSERGGIDVFNGEAAKAQLKLAVEELMAAGNAELAGKLMLMTQSFVSVADYAAKAAQEAAKAAQDAYNNARDAAFANLESAVDRERSYWDGIASAAQTAVGSLSSTLNLLTSNARDLYGTVDTTQQMLAAQGMVYIEGALAGVRGGASASSYSGLQDAITAARGGISGGRYASQFDKDRDALVLAGQLSQLGDLTGSQLSVEERSLKAAQTQIDLLDQTLDYWRELIEGNKDGHLSVVEAINQLAQAMGVTASGPGGLLGGGASFGGGSGAAGATGTAGAADPESFKYIRDTWLYDNHYARRGTDDAALDPLADLMRSFSGSKDSFAMLSAARDAGYRLTDVQAASTAVDGVWRASTYEQWLQEAQRVGIPAFDVGTNLVPHDMLAVVHKNEAIVPAAFNPWAGGSGMGMSTARLESLVERLIDENRHLSDRLLAIERNTQGLPQMADQFDTVASSGRVRVVAS